LIVGLVWLAGEAVSDHEEQREGERFAEVA
jgi:hypothetical protein